MIILRCSSNRIQPPGPVGLEEQDSHSPSHSESEGTENISGSHIIIPNNPSQDPDAHSDLLSSGNEHERPKFDDETQKPEDKEEEGSEGSHSGSGRGLKRSDISEERKDAKKTRIDKNDIPMISIGLDPAPQQPANTLPCKQFTAIIDCTHIGRSVSPPSSEEGDEPLTQSYLLVQQVIPIVAENGTN